MRRIATTLLASALCGADQTPIADLTLSDLGRTLTRIEAGVWGKTWNEPALAPWRAQAATAAAAINAKAGFDVLAMIRSLKDLNIHLDHLAKGKDENSPVDAKFHAQVNAGAFAEVLWTLLSKNPPPKSKPVTIPGADAAIQSEGTGQTPIAGALARFGKFLVSGTDLAALAPHPVAPSETDIRVSFDQVRLQTAIETFQGNDAGAAITKDFVTKHPELFAAVSWTVTAVPEGFLERITGGASPGSMPVDRAVLGRLPANAMMVVAAGIDGEAAWNVFGSHLMDMIAAKASQSGMDTTGEQLLGQGDAFLQALGLKVGIVDLVKGLKGTCLIAVTPSMPFPAVTIAIPRSAALDQVVTWALTKAELDLPTDGSPLAIPLPDVPVAPNLVANKTHWMITTDGMVANAWAEGKDGGYLTSKAAVELLKRAPIDAGLLGTSDTPVVLKQIAGYAALIPVPDKKQKQLMLTAINKLAANASTGYVWSRAGTDRSELELRGIAGSLIIPAFVAGMATPILMESRVTASRAAASATLKSGVFVGQVQFQAGAYRDADGDGRGEYGLIGMLAGDTDDEVGPKKVLSLITADFAGVDPIRNGYQYRVYLPTGAQTGSSDLAEVNAAAKKAEACTLQEQFWVSYAWPVDGEGKAFALCANGMVYSADAADVGEPDWNSLFGENGWGIKVDESLWQVPERNR